MLLISQKSTSKSSARVEIEDGRHGRAGWWAMRANSARCRGRDRTRAGKRAGSGDADDERWHPGRQRHKVLLEELEMLVEPVLKYRHSGVYDAQRYHYSAHEGDSISCPERQDVMH